MHSYLETSLHLAPVSRMARAKCIRLAVVLIGMLCAISFMLTQATLWRRVSTPHSHRDHDVRRTSAFTAPAEVEAVNISVLGLHGVKVMRFCNVSDGVFMPPLVCCLRISLSTSSNHLHVQACEGNLKTGSSPVNPPHAPSQPPDILLPHNLTAASVPMCVLLGTLVPVWLHCSITVITSLIIPLCRAAQVQRSFDRACSVRRQRF